MNQFTIFGLNESIIHSLDKLQIQTPTSIQAQVLPLALKQKDILASSQTGTGKTFAFLLPIIHQLIELWYPQALILAPTRELASQISDSLKKLLTKEIRLSTALLIGGESMTKQLTQLKKNPHIIIGTPGRIVDHLNRKSLSLQDVKFFVLDEMDRMLDMGFLQQIEVIEKKLPKERQTFMFSATMPQHIIKQAQHFLKDPVRIAVHPTTQPVEKIKQEARFVDTQDKKELLMQELKQRSGSIIIFTKTRIGAEKLAKFLSRNNFEAIAIHGELQQRKRDRILRHFRDEELRILVATDIAARGLDIPHIQHVINYDLPQCPEDYIHRIGRTARAGAEGCAVSLIAPIDKKRWRDIQKLIHPKEEVSKEKQAAIPAKTSLSNFKKRSKSTQKKFSKDLKNPFFREKAKLGKKKAKKVFKR